MVVAGLLSKVFFLSCGLSQRETVSARRLPPPLYQLLFNVS